MRAILYYIFLLSLIVCARADEAGEEASVSEEPVASSETKEKYVKPVPKGAHHFFETFDINSIGSK
jgi:hypothetical protein